MYVLSISIYLSHYKGYNDLKMSSQNMLPILALEGLKERISLHQITE